MYANIKRHQEDVMKQWGSEAEVDAILGPSIQSIVDKAGSNPQFLQKVKTALRAGNIKQLDSFLSRAPKELSRTILTKTYNAMADAGLL